MFSLRKVFTGASVYSLGEVLAKASGFFLIPLYTRLLSPADYGIIGYLQVVLQIATVIVGFGFHGAQTRYCYESPDDKQAIGGFAYTINLIPVGVGVLLVLPLSIFGGGLGWTVGKSAIPFAPHFVLTLWTVIFQVMATNAISYFRARQRFVLAAVSQFGRFLSVTMFTLMLIVGRDMGALGRIWGLFLGTGLFVVVGFIPYAKDFSWKPSLSQLQYAVAYGGPIIVHLLASTAHNAIDRLILERMVTLDQLGIYTLAFTVGNAFNVFIVAFNQAFQPSYFGLMASDEQDKKHQILRTFRLWLLLVTTIATVGLIFGAPFVRVFAGSEFGETARVFPWMILAVFVGGFYYFFSAPLFHFKKTSLLPAITVVSAVCNIGLNLLLIPRMGITGAAIATLISHAVQSIIALIIGNRLFAVRWPLRWIAGSMVVVSVATYLGQRLFG